MATMTERRPGVWVARVFVKPTAGEAKGKQITRTFRGGKRAVARAVAEWEREVQGTAAAGVGLNVEQLLARWQKAKAAEWQPTTARDHGHRARAVTRDLGSVRLADLDPMRIDAWVARLRREGVGE